MKPIRFWIDENLVQASQDESILDVCNRLGIELDHSCGGFGSCGTCRIYVEKCVDSLAPRNEIEEEIAQDRGFEKSERLACQTHPVEGLRIRRPAVIEGD